MLPMPRRQDQIATERERERGTFLSLNHQKGSLLKGCRYSNFRSQRRGKSLEKPTAMLLCCAFLGILTGQPFFV